MFDRAVDRAAWRILAKTWKKSGPTVYFQSSGLTVGPKERRDGDGLKSESGVLYRRRGRSDKSSGCVGGRRVHADRAAVKDQAA